AQERVREHRVLRPEQPWGRGGRRLGLSRHSGRRAGGARCDDRQGEMGREGGRRAGGRLHRDDGPPRDRGYGDHRDLGRRVRHSRLREGLQRGDRRARVDVVHYPVAAGRRVVGPLVQDHARGRRSEARHREGESRFRQVRRRVATRRRLDVDDAGLRRRHEDPVRRHRQPVALHPDLGYAYTVGLHQPMHYKVHYAPWENGRLWLGSAFVRIPDDKGGYSGEYGNVNAIDLNTGKIAWTVKTELPMMGGATATAGGLVFTGEGNGWFKAYDAKTGTVLWKFYCGAGVNAAPSVFEVDGEQFVAVAAGGNFQISYPLGNSVFVFGLPKAGM